MEILKVQEQLDNNRKTVSFDSYDITVRQLSDMVIEDLIDIAPEYQRHFVWDEQRQSQLIESIFLGIPVPSLFMATNKDSTWEVIDGLQRLTTIINYIGDIKTIKQVNPSCDKLKIEGLEKLAAINGSSFEDLPKSLQNMFLTRPIRVTVLNDRSDFSLRFDLFERLNTGGVILHPQEIRNCIYLGEFNDFLKQCVTNSHFNNVIKMTKNAERTGSLDELALKFFAYYEDREFFVHSVKDFLNTYMARKTGSFKNKNELLELFEKTFKILDDLLPEGIVRGNRKNITPIVLYEAIAVGVADLIAMGKLINKDALNELLNDSELNKLTTGATNSRKKLYQRIEFVKERLS